MTFQYDRVNGTPEKKFQRDLQRVVQPMERKLLQKVLDFIDKI